MNLTIRNHYNPCFWTAHWNPAYFNLAVRGERHKADARQQRVFVLNVKSNKIYPHSVENVHYDKGIGVAEIAPDAAKDFCQRRFPDEYEQFCKDLDANPVTAYLDFENILTCLEGTPSYMTLLEVIRKGIIGSLRQKGELVGFVAVHHLRSHALMNSMVELTATRGYRNSSTSGCSSDSLAKRTNCFSLRPR